LNGKEVGEPCEDCVNPGSRSALLLAAAKNQQSNADPANITNPIVEQAIRKELKKPTGELTKADLEQVSLLNLSGNKLTEVPRELEKLTQLDSVWLAGNQLTDVKGLEKLTQLGGVYLMDNQLTSVKGLEKLTQLEILYLQDNPDLTKAQIDELKKALPNCDIGHNAKE
jgi:Leucine-rich repeat (LRR) protein